MKGWRLEIIDKSQDQEIRLDPTIVLSTYSIPHFTLELYYDDDLVFEAELASCTLHMGSSGKTILDFGKDLERLNEIDENRS